MSKPDYHNGEVWARAEAARKAAAQSRFDSEGYINIYCEAQPQRTLGQIAYEAAVGYCRAMGHPVAYQPWSRATPHERSVWCAAATAVRRAVGR